MMGKQSYFPNPVSQAPCMTGTLSLIEGQRLSVEAPTSIYPDLPFSSAASFNLPAQCDSSLLTPNSTSGSPLLLPGSDFRSQKYPSPGTPHKALTPPDSTTMYPFNNQFEMNSQTSQNGSPMTQPASTPGEFGDASYVVEGRRTPNPPAEVYMGSFGVSEGAMPHGLQTQGSPFYMMQNAPPVDHLLRDDHLDVPRHMSRQLPLHYHHVKPEPRDGPETLFSSRVIEGYTAPSRHSRTTSRARPKRGSTGRKSTPARPPLQSRDPVEEHMNCHGEERAPMLKENCPDEERCIFESRWRHRQQKGQDMWNSISRDYARAFGSKATQKEKLQMKYTRGRKKFYRWEHDDENLLRRAWWIVERERYETILSKFLELGGSRNMNLSAADIENKVTKDLKLDEDVYIQPLPETSVRRRRRPPARSFVPGFEDPPSFQNTRHEDEIIRQIHMQPSWEQGSHMTPNSILVQLPEGRPIKMEPGVAHESHGAFNRTQEE